MLCSNDNYMQDLYYYNQIPNNTYMGNIPNNIGNSIPIMGNMQNPSMINNNVFPQNQTMYGNNTSQGINNLYPSIYRIIYPVVSRIVSNNNYQYMNEDNLNNMVDTVFNIIEGPIDYDDEVTPNSTPNISTQNNSNTQTSNNNNSNNLRQSENKTNIQTTNRHTRNDNLLRDIIKILIIREILSRRIFQNQQQFGNTCPYYNTQSFMNPIIF